MVSVSASVNLPLHHKVQKFSSGTDSPGWSRKKGCKTAAVVVQGQCFKLCTNRTSTHIVKYSHELCEYATEAINIQFGMLSRVGPWNMYYMGI